MQLNNFLYMFDPSSIGLAPLYSYIILATYHNLNLYLVYMHLFSSMATTHECVVTPHQTPISVLGVGYQSTYHIIEYYQCFLT